jgi:hypothetical protein
MDQSQLMILSGSQFRGFDQYMLYVFVALLESGVRRTLSAELFSSPHSPQ